MEQQPTLVLATTTQIGETPPCWSGVEPSVWTERMLTALQRGVKGAKSFEEHGLFNLEKAHASLRQSSLR